MRRLAVWLAVALAVGLLLSSGARSSGEATTRPGLCDNYAALRTTVEHIRDVKVSQHGVRQLKPYLTQLAGQVAQLFSEAKAQFQGQKKQLKAASDQLGRALRAAKDNPSKANLARVRTATAAVRASWKNLGTALGAGC